MAVFAALAVVQLHRSLFRLPGHFAAVDQRTVTTTLTCQD
jgi:hypothetical protein